MIGGREPAWLRRRADEERRLADVANGTPAKRAHQQLADLYEREADEREGQTLQLVD